MRSKVLLDLVLFSWFSLGVAIPNTQALPLLPFPTANDIKGPFFVQPFAGLPITSESGGIGKTAPFFSDLPDGVYPKNKIVNILGNFQGFDALGAPTAFDIVGVEVTIGAAIFTPMFGELDFAGNASVTFEDALDFDQVTFFDGDFTLAFTFTGDESLAYSYSLFTTGLDLGGFVLYDDAEGTAPEPGTFLLLGFGLAGLVGLRKRAASRSTPRSALIIVPATVDAGLRSRAIMARYSRGWKPRLRRRHERLAGTMINAPRS